jgi:hypothetical protein
MSCLSGSVGPEGVDIVTDLKKTISNKIFAHLRPSSFFLQPMVRKNLTKIKPKPAVTGSGALWQPCQTSRGYIALTGSKFCDR